MLSSGCNLVVLGVLNQSFYRVGDVKFLCLTIDKDELRKSYRDNGFEIKFWEEYCPPEKLETDPEFSDFQTAFIMHAVKIWGNTAISNVILAKRRCRIFWSYHSFWAQLVSFLQIFFSGGSRESRCLNPIFSSFFFLIIFKIIRKMENKWRKTAWNSLSFPVCFSSTDQNDVELIMLLFGHTFSVYFSHFIICFLLNNYVNMNQTCHLVYSKLYLICEYYIQCNPSFCLDSPRNMATNGTSCFFLGPLKKFFS